jgi:hypothetical protein
MVATIFYSCNINEAEANCLSSECSERYKSDDVGRFCEILIEEDPRTSRRDILSPAFFSSLINELRSEKKTDSILSRGSKRFIRKREEIPN